MTQSEARARPFNTFNFLVKVTLDDGKDVIDPIDHAGFAECTGLEVSADIKTIRQGGDNGRQIHLVGPISYSTLTLKRGMTRSFHLWNWFDIVLRQGQRHKRAVVQIQLLPSKVADREPEAEFVLTGCLPVKIRAADLNARTGEIAIEEMQIAYEVMSFSPGAARNA